jgi:hypothetical protein
MAKKKAVQLDQKSDLEDESVAEEYSSASKAAKKRRRMAI